VPIQLEPITITVPEYLQLPGGHHRVAVIIEGTATSSQVPRGTAQVWFDTPARLPREPQFEMKNERVYADKQPWLLSEPGSGFLFDGRFYGDDEDGRAMAAELVKSGAIRDALRCRLVEEALLNLDGTRSAFVLGNDYNDSSPAGAHVLVIETEGEIAEPISVEVVATGERRLEDHHLLWAVLNPSKARRRGVCDAFVFWPKTEACQVRFKSLTGQADPVAPALRSASVYALLDYRANGSDEQPQAKRERRTLTLMPTHTEQMYHGFGYDGNDRMNREFSLRKLLEYMRFVGFTRLAFHAVGDRMLCFYDDGLLNNAWRWDVFEDVLPLAEVAGVDVVPVLPSPANYSELFAFTDPDSFQVGASGELVADERGNRCPDPLRPEVQEQLLWFLSELVERAEGHRCVTAIGMTVDGGSGTCYASPGGGATGTTFFAGKSSTIHSSSARALKGPLFV